MLLKSSRLILLFFSIFFGEEALSASYSNEHFELVDAEFNVAVGPTEIGNRFISFINTSNEIITINAKTMDVLWKTQLPGEMNNLYNLSAVGGSRGMLYYAWGNVLYALNSSNGSIVWKKSVSSIIRGKPAVFGGAVFISTINERIYAISEKDGSEIWTHSSANVEIQKVRSIGPSISKSGEIIALLSRNVLLSLSTLGETIFSKVLRNFEATFSPLIYKNSAILTNGLGSIEAYNVNDGERLWKANIDANSEPFIVSDKVLFVTSSREFFAIDAKNGKILQKYSLTDFADSGISDEEMIQFSVKIDDDAVVLLSDGGHALMLTNNFGTVSSITLPIQSGKEIVEVAPAAGYIYFRLDDGSVFYLYIYR